MLISPEPEVFDTVKGNTDKDKEEGVTTFHLLDKKGKPDVRKDPDRLTNYDQTGNIQPNPIKPGTIVDRKV